MLNKSPHLVVVGAVFYLVHTVLSGSEFMKWVLPPDQHPMLTIFSTILATMSAWLFGLVILYKAARFIVVAYDCAAVITDRIWSWLRMQTTQVLKRMLECLDDRCP